MAATGNTKRSFRVSCPYCGEDCETCIGIFLNKLTIVTCYSCERRGTPDQFAARAAENAQNWEMVLNWIKAAES